MVSDEEIFLKLKDCLPLRSEGSTLVFQMTVTQTDEDKIISSKINFIELSDSKTLQNIFEGLIKQVKLKFKTEY
jgi:hypothetical protein